MTTTIRMADVSEFQPNVDANAYQRGGYQIIIARTYNGYRPDNTMPGRRDYLRGQNLTGIGYYAYLTTGVDVGDQARQFINTVGQLRANEWPILDLEEGSGDQTGRAQAWFNVVDPWAGFPAMLYSGQSFLQTHLGGAGRWAGRPIWIASYGSAEPSDTHILWQFTDAYQFPGIGSCDGNLHHGTPQEFMSTVRAGHTPPTEEEIVAIAAALTAGGTLEVFVEAQDGSVWHTWQKKGETSWSGGKPGVASAGLSKLCPPPGK